MRKPRFSTIIFLTCWCTAASTTVWYIDHWDKAAPEIKPIANLAKKIGAVDYRTLDAVLWRRAELNQAFARETRIATGHGSKATIAIEDGRTLILDPDSLIVLSKSNAQKTSDDGAFIVTLAKGRVVLEADQKQIRKKTKKRQKQNYPEPPKLIFKTNDQILTVRNTEHPVILVRPQLESSTKVLAHAGAVETRPAPPPEPPSKPIVSVNSVKQALSLLAQSIPGATPPPSPPPIPKQDPASNKLATSTSAKTPEPPPEADPMPVQPNIESQPARQATAEVDAKQPMQTSEPVNVVGFEPTLRIAGRDAPNQVVLWTNSKPDETLPPLEVAVMPPANRNRPEWDWTPVIRVQELSKGTRTLRGINAYRSQVLQIPLEDKGNRRSLARGWNLTLTGGLLAGGAAHPETMVFAEQSSRVLLRSFITNTKGPLTVFIDSYRGPEHQSRGWIRETRRLPSSGLPSVWQIELVHGSDLSKLSSLILRSKAFSIKEGVDENSPKNPVKVTLVADRQIQAIMTADQLPDLGKVRQVAQMLGSQLAYIGPPEALLPRDADLASLRTNSGSIFAANLIDGEACFSLHQIFVSDYPNLQRFLGSNSSALFDRRVEIVIPGLGGTDKKAPVAH